jgi:TonB family protein
MEGLTAREYKSLERSASNSETNARAVEHNGRTGPEAGTLLREQPTAPEPATNMANDLLTQPDTDSRAVGVVTGDREFDGLLGRSFEEKSIWASLYESIRDVFFPRKLPPLQLTSTPIPVPDRMAVRANPWAIGISTGVNVAILLVVLFFVGKKIIETVKTKELTTNIDVGVYTPQGPKGDAAHGGGGGGAHDLVEPMKGKLPKLEKNPVTPPMVPVIEHPKLAIESAINVQQDIKLPDPNLPNIGVSKSANVRLQSNGTGSGGGMGSGSGGGLGSGTGNGYGPGYGGNTGGGLYHVGGGVSAPVALNTVEAEFSDEARRAKYQGVCLVALIVDAQGNPQSPRVIRALGMGLDEKALEAVRKYKFKPAMKDGRTPVPVPITVEVDFRLY